MAGAFELISLSPTNTLTITTYVSFYRTDLPVPTQMTWLQGDDTERDGRILNILIQANGGGTPASLTLDQIIGGHDGTHICIMMLNAADDLTVLHDPAKIFVSSYGTNLEVTSNLQPLSFVNRGGVYAYKGF